MPADSMGHCKLKPSEALLHCSATFRCLFISIDGVRGSPGHGCLAHVSQWSSRQSRRSVAHSLSSSVSRDCQRLGTWSLHTAERAPPPDCCSIPQSAPEMAAWHTLPSEINEASACMHIDGRMACKPVTWPVDTSHAERCVAPY